MLLNTTHRNNEQIELVEDLIGRPFSFVQKVRMNGVQSKRMLIEQTSQNLNLLFHNIPDLIYSYIVLRPNGIIVHISDGRWKYDWVIPYFHLSIYESPTISLHAQGNSILFKNNVTYRENKEFFGKLTAQKITYDAQYEFQSRTSKPKY
jgi:hypothetical protein